MDLIVVAEIIKAVSCSGILDYDYHGSDYFYSHSSEKARIIDSITNMPSATNTNSARFTVEPLPKDATKKTNFGAVINNLDLSNISGMTLVKHQ